MSRRWAAVVIGAGIVGLSTARSLVERGVRDVLVLEQRTPASGASGLGAGSVHTQRWRPLDVQLVVRSKQILTSLGAETGGMTSIRPSGRLTLVSGADGALLADYAEMIARYVGDLTLLSSEEIAARWPYLNVGDGLVGAFTASDGVVIPPAICWAFAGLIRRGGGVIWEGAAATRVIPEGDSFSIEMADGSRIGADKVVVAAGPWSAGLLLRSGVSLPDTRVETQTAVVRLSEAAGAWGMPNILDVPNGESTIIPRNPGTLCIGGYVGSSRSGEDATALFGEPSDDDYNRKVLELVDRRFRPGTLHGIVGGWRGVVDVTPDRLPLVGDVPGLPGVLVGCGFGGYGVQRGPAIGEALADRVLGFPDRIDLSDCNPARFSGMQLDGSGVQHDTDNAFTVRVGR